MHVNLLLRKHTLYASASWQPWRVIVTITSITQTHTPSHSSSLPLYSQDDITYVGSPDAPAAQDIVLTGAEIKAQHARFIVGDDGEVRIRNYVR